MNSKSRKLMVTAALSRVAANPVLTNMRNTAYAPVTLKEFSRNDEEAIIAAEAKRLRKQERNKKNGLS